MLILMIQNLFFISVTHASGQKGLPLKRVLFWFTLGSFFENKNWVDEAMGKFIVF